MFKKLAGLTKRRTLTIYILAAFVLLLGGGTFYYFKYYKIGADTLPRNTSCVIKVVDKDTGTPVKDVQALFMVMPIGSTTVSDANGCVALPSALANTKTGDYYQVSLNHQKFANNLFYLSIGNETLSGKRQNKVELYPVSADSTGTSLPASSTNQIPISNNFINKAQAESFQTVYGSVDIYDALSTVSNSENYAKASPLADAKIDFFDQNKKKVGECYSDVKGTCKIEVKIATEMTSINGTVYKTNYKTDFVQFNLATDKDTVGWLNREIYLWPDYVAKPIKTFTGNSKLVKCQASYSFPATFVALKADINKPLWDEVSIQESADNLASVICALKQSKDGLTYIPIPKLYIVNAESKLAAGWVSVGSSYISVMNKQFCGGMNTEERKVCNKSDSDRAWRFTLPVHEYGHVLDSAGLGGYGRISDEDYNPNFRNLFALVNAVNEKDEYQGKAVFGDCKIFNGKAKYQGTDGHYNCYYTTNRAEFWAESFTRYMGMSLASDLKLDLGYIKANSLSLIKGRLDSNADTLNAYKFWKKFMATTLGSYCHPTIIDDNERKTGMTYAPPFDPPTVTNSKFVVGGPFAKDTTYVPEDILAGKATDGPYLKVYFKQLLTDYKTTGLTIGVSMKCAVSAGGASRDCYYGPYSISMKDTDLLGADRTMTFMMPQAGMSKYDIIATYKCSKDKEDSSMILKGGQELDTEKPNQEVTIDFTKFPGCSSGTMPGQPAGTPSTSQPPTGSPMGPGMPVAQ